MTRYSGSVNALARVTLLGDFGLTVDGEPVDLKIGLTSGIVARLALEPGVTVPGEGLIEDLWDEPTAGALNTIRSQVSRLRSGVMGDVLTGGRAGYSLTVPRENVDLHRLRALIATAADEQDPTAAFDQLRQAERLWGETLFPRLDRFPFVARERAALADSVRTAALRLTELRIARGDVEDALAPLARMVEASPLHERPVILLATALSKAGRPSDALATIDGFRRRLRDSEGLDLPEASEQLRASIVRRDAAIAETSVSEVERHGVAVPLTQLVGRREELDAIEAARLEARVVTLVGAGGVGKTRLAMESARRATRTGDEVQWVIELADLIGSDILAAVSDAVGSNDGAIESVARQLSARRTLLILDNAEHVLADVAEFVSDIVARCPGLAVLVTSREALRIPGERVVIIRTWDDVMLDDAVALFVDRVRDVRPEFEATPKDLATIRAICRRLDGLPLGIELVASLADVLDLTELEHSVEQGSMQVESPRGAARHRSLASVIDWSFGLLDEPERRMLAQLAGFAGSFTLDTVAGICESDIDARRLTASLAQKSLVAVTVAADGTRRYRLLESVRQYATPLASEEERSRWLRRHAQWHAAQLDTLREELRGAGETALQVTLEAGRPDFHLALDTAIEAGDRNLALRLVGGLAWHWFRRNSIPDGRIWMSRALAVPGDADPEIEAWARVGAIMFAFQSGDQREMYDSIAAGVSAAQRAGNETALQLILGYERYADSLLKLEKLPAYADFELPDLSHYPAWVQAELLSMHGQLLRALGRPAKALDVLAEAQRLCARIGYGWCHGSALYMSAKIMVDLKRGKDAARLARRGLLLAARGPSATSALSHLDTLAGACAYLERHRDGALLFGFHDNVARQYGLFPAQKDTDDATRRNPVRQGLTTQEWDEYYARGAAMPYAKAIEFALTIAPPEDAAGAT
ncbi:MAG: putative ATPase [Rhodoglobus sp.]|nr:putative ATPase [Rhodoglobus sp.]